MRGWGIICNRTQIQMSDLKDQKIFAHKPREVCRAFCNSRNNRKLLKLKEKWRKLANLNRSERAWEHLLSSYLLPFNSFSIYISMFIYIYRYKRLFCKNQSNWVEPIIEKLAATSFKQVGQQTLQHCSTKNLYVILLRKYHPEKPNPSTNLQFILSWLIAFLTEPNKSGN